MVASHSGIRERAAVVILIRISFLQSSFHGIIHAFRCYIIVKVLVIVSMAARLSSVVDILLFADADLKKLAQEVIDLLKVAIGVEEFSVVFATCQKSLFEKRGERKRQRAVAVSATD